MKTQPQHRTQNVFAQIGTNLGTPKAQAAMKSADQLGAAINTAERQGDASDPRPVLEALDQLIATSDPASAKAALQIYATYSGHDLEGMVDRVFAHDPVGRAQIRARIDLIHGVPSDIDRAKSDAKVQASEDAKLACLEVLGGQIQAIGAATDADVAKKIDALRAGYVSMVKVAPWLANTKLAESLKDPNATRESITLAFGLDRLDASRTLLGPIDAGQVDAAAKASIAQALANLGQGTPGAASAMTQPPDAPLDVEAFYKAMKAKIDPGEPGLIDQFRNGGITAEDLTGEAGSILMMKIKDRMTMLQAMVDGLRGIQETYNKALEQAAQQLGR